MPDQKKTRKKRVGARHLSRFMRKTFMPDEKLVREAYFPRFYVFTCWFSFAAYTLLGAAGQYVAWKYFGVQEGWILAFGVFVGAWQFFWMMLKKWTTEIVLTDRRLIYKRGFFMIHIEEVDIEQLASDNVIQSILGRMMDFGALRIRCIEASDIMLPAIHDPYGFRNAIEGEKHNYREHYMKIERLRRHGEGDR
ncbi:MAG: PH domain-containing protein [Alphaproteobacteria bacterium]|nr:PH domain-containing protein [Alphaproteobacteria bacterium]